MTMERLVQAVRARGGRGAWWAEPDPAAIARTDAKLQRRTGRPLPSGIASLWARFDGLVIGKPGASTPTDPIVAPAYLEELRDLTGGELIVPADHEMLFEYLDDGLLSGHLLLGALSEVDVLTLSPVGAVHVTDVGHFEDGPLQLAATFDDFLDAWCAADLRAGTIAEALRAQHPERMTIYRGHRSYLTFRAGDTKPVRLLIALTAGVPLEISLHDVTGPTSVALDVAGESRLELTEERATVRFAPTRTGDHEVRVEGTGPFTIAFTIAPNGDPTVAGSMRSHEAR